MTKSIKLNQEAHFYHCPIEAALDVMGSKWKGVILYHLMHGTKRFSDLKRLIPYISQRILTLQLRQLENDSIIIRKVYPQVPPKVEYSFSPLGEKLVPILLTLQTFGEHILEAKSTPA